MITESSVYWLTRLDAIHAWIDVVSVVLWLAAATLVLGAIMTYLASTDYSDKTESHDKMIRLSRKCLTAALVITATVVFAIYGVQTLVPTTREMAAVKVIPAIANSQTARDPGSEITSLAEEWLAELHSKRARHAPENR